MSRLLFIVSTIFVFAPAFGQPDIDKVRSTLSKNTIEGHIYFLASDELRGRETGSPEIDIAAEYLATSFRRYGVDPVPGAEEGYFQPVLLEKVSPATTKKITVGDLQFDDLVMLTGGNFDSSLEVIYLGHGLEKDYEKADAKDKLVVVMAGDGEQSDARSALTLSPQKREWAQMRGAKALVEINAYKPELWAWIVNHYGGESTRLKEGNEDGFPHLWLRDGQNKFISAIDREKKALIAVSGMNKADVSAKNVIGMVEGTDPELKNEFVIYSAHYDHIGVGRPDAAGDSIYNGARDNAVGVVTVMSAAENIAKFPTKRSALFILFTAEEKGLLGSRWYANHPLVPLDQVVYCFNSDNGGYNDTSTATIVGLGRTTAEGHIKQACKEFGLEALDDPDPEQGLFDRSDNVSFAVKGVPAPTFSMGFRAFDEEIMKYYHQVADHAESLDYDYLTRFFGAYVLACRLIANDPATPFWVDGDKYHDAGVNLYKAK